MEAGLSVEGVREVAASEVAALAAEAKEEVAKAVAAE